MTDPLTVVAGLDDRRETRRLRVMGILNVTPDSFSDGGRWVGIDAAVAHGIQMYEAGADLIDVGGESTRPGAPRVDPEIELTRVIPVLTELADAGVPCSIDTTRAVVAEAAVEAGAEVVNDVSGGLGDPLMAKTVAELEVPWILMHWRAPSDTMTDHAQYDDVVTDVLQELGARVDAALAAGVRPEALIIDPGIGFAKTAEHNWTLLNRLPELLATGFPVLIGASRKRFLPPSGAAPGSPADLAIRDAATATVTALVAAQGAWGVRVHDVPGSIRAADLVAAVQSEGLAW